MRIKKRNKGENNRNQIFYNNKQQYTHIKNTFLSISIHTMYCKGVA